VPPFYKISQDYTHRVFNAKLEVLKMISENGSNIKCAKVLFYDMSFLEIILKCNYNPRELLKFFLELDMWSLSVSVIIWFEDGTCVCNYSVTNKEIPKELQG